MTARCLSSPSHSTPSRAAAAFASPGWQGHLLPRASFLPGSCSHRLALWPRSPGRRLAGALEGRSPSSGALPWAPAAGVTGGEGLTWCHGRSRDTSSVENLPCMGTHIPIPISIYKSIDIYMDNWLWSCCACVPGCVGVFFLRLLPLPKLASPVTLVVRVNAMDVLLYLFIYISTLIHVIIKRRRQRHDILVPSAEVASATARIGADRRGSAWIARRRARRGAGRCGSVRVGLDRYGSVGTARRGGRQRWEGANRCGPPWIGPDRSGPPAGGAGGRWGAAARRRPLRIGLDRSGSVGMGRDRPPEAGPGPPRTGAACARNALEPRWGDRTRAAA